jgi:NAD(P)H dehydrogenase (quinone)
MIINFHPKEKESKKGKEVIDMLLGAKQQEVFHVTDKSYEAWKELIAGQEELVLVAPTYWWGFGYEFDKWAQEVFAYGFGYEYNEQGMPVGLLKKRPFTMHITHGTPTSMATVMLENMKKRLETGIFGFCDATVDVHFYQA